MDENPPIPITPVPTVFMPQLKQRDAVSMTTLLIGDRVVEEGCLRFRDIYTVVGVDELGKMRIVFETILRTLRPADAP